MMPCDRGHLRAMRLLPFTAAIAYSEVMSGLVDPRQQEIAQQWDARGRPDCTHDEHERHKIEGQDQGDYICTGCGVDWWRNGPPPGPQAAARFL